MSILGVDTALQNCGFVVLDGLRAIHASKPDLPLEDPLKQMARIKFVVDDFKKLIRAYAINLVAFEDYVLSGHQKAYETAELLGCLKMVCWENKIPYCLVHPSKTKKYVVKKREVSKTEIIEYVRQHDPGCLEKLPKNQWSDAADAWVIAQIGSLVWSAYEWSLNSHPILYRFDWKVWGDTLPIRWQELLYTDGSGILTKPGLSVFNFD